ncbi:MAG: DinB family protein [Candidatus Kapaibacterium sp.]
MTDKTYYKDAPSYCHYYFDLLQTDNVINELEKSRKLTLDTIELITPEKENFSYLPNKWTTLEVLKHIIVCERIYTYRALRFSRFDNTELAGFDENEYTANVKKIKYHLKDLLDEYINVRNASMNLFKNMTEEMLNFKGKANNAYFTPRTIGFMTAGHNIHHCNFIKTYYLNDI